MISSALRLIKKPLNRCLPRKLMISEQILLYIACIHNDRFLDCQALSWTVRSPLELELPT